MHSKKLVIAMSIDTYGLPSEQYEEFFEDNIRFAAKLYKRAHAILDEEDLGYLELKATHELFTDAVYATNDDCRKYQKANNPEAIKDTDLFGIYPSREDMMEEIKAVSAKVEALTEYVTELVKVTTKGLEGIAENLVD